MNHSFVRALRGVCPPLSIALMGGCSSSSGGTSGAGGTQFACVMPGACIFTTGLTTQTLASVQADCDDAKGTGAAQCPTTGLTTCCIEFAAGAASEIFCAYGDSGAPGDPTATRMCNQ